MRIDVDRVVEERLREPRVEVARIVRLALRNTEVRGGRRFPLPAHRSDRTPLGHTDEPTEHLFGTRVAMWSARGGAATSPPQQEAAHDPAGHDERRPRSRPPANRRRAHRRCCPRRPPTLSDRASSVTRVGARLPGGRGAAGLRVLAVIRGGAVLRVRGVVGVGALGLAAVLARSRRRRRRRTRRRWPTASTVGDGAAVTGGGACVAGGGSVGGGAQPDDGAEAHEPGRAAGAVAPALDRAVGDGGRRRATARVGPAARAGPGAVVRPVLASRTDEARRGRPGCPRR